MKHNIPYYLLAFLVAASGWSCQQPTTAVKSALTSSEEVKTIIDEKNDQLEILYKTGQIDSAATYFAEDVIQMPPNSPAIKGIEMYKKRWKEATQMAEWDFQLEALEVRRTGDMAIELGKYTLSLTPTENSPIPAMNDSGHYLVLWELIDGDWKIVWDAPVSENPLPMPE